MAVGWRLAARYRALRPISSLGGKRKLISRRGGFQALSCPFDGSREASYGGRCLLAEGELLWQRCFSNSLRWRNNRSEGSPQEPDFGHRTSKVALSLKNGCKSVSTSGRRGSRRVANCEDGSELVTCRKLCEDGQVTEAVDGINLLVQEGRHIPRNLFYRVLKMCIGTKDIDLGRRIHALTVKNGYEGDAFLATHLICLHASYGRLEEAMHVFTKVSTPSAYMWASIIKASTTHGEPAQAIGLYRLMRESPVTPDNRIFVAVLKACAGARDLVAGKDVHAHILASAGKPDVFVQNALVAMYSKCGSIEDARKVFDRLPYRDVVTWTAMIAGYAQQGMGQQAITLYTSMQKEGTTSPNSVTFVCLLQACASVGAAGLNQGKQLHMQIEERGLLSDVVVGNSLVNMYSRCASVEDAQKVFDRLSRKNVATWNAMIAGYAQQGMGQAALSLYSRMQQECITPPDSVTFVCLLQACAGVGVEALHQGKQLHARIEERGLQADVVVGNSVVNMYAKCGSLGDAQRAFDRLSHKDVVTWNAMITGCAQQGMPEEALSMYSSMQEEGITLPDLVTFLCLLQACASIGVGALHQGKQLHAQIEERGLQDDVVLGASLVNMYAKCGRLTEAQSVFDRLSQKDVVTWTAMIAGYAQQGRGQEALRLNSAMQSEGISLPNSVTYVCLLQACASLAALPLGKQLHAEIDVRGLQDDVVLGASLVNMYAKCGSIEDSQRVFEKISEKDVVTWNAMITGYAQQGMGVEALALYSSMQQEGIMSPDSITFVCLLQACAGLGPPALEQGKQLHAQIEECSLQADVIICNSLVNMYAKCGSLENAQRVFDGLLQKNVVTWNTMIAGYAQQGMGQEALDLFSRMQQEGKTTPDSVTFGSLLQACASVAALPLGKQIHAQVEERGLQGDVIIGSSLVNMYAKCGSLEDAQQAFDLLPQRDILAWGALIGGYARQGDSELVFDLVDRMRMEGIQPDGITLLSVLTVCSHGGLVDKGRKYLEEMTTEYGITPTAQHYTCMIDLLSRAGHIDEALRMVKSMPFQPNGAMWVTLLGACQKWSNIEVGRQAFDSAVRLNEKNAASYVLMSNIYADAHMLEEAKEIQARRVKCGAWKEPGRTWWTDMEGVVHSFVVGERKHSEVDGIIKAGRACGENAERSAAF